MSDVIVRSQRGLTTSIEIGEHRLVADEPVASGGADQGPNPYELLLSALGACTAMTVQLYAQRKGWPLSGVEVTLRHERIHARDCVDCETQDVMLDKITKQITLLGELNEEQRERLRDIAERCPVQRTLQREVRIESTLL